MILYVVRHGETEWNKEKRMQGQTDIPLSQEGIRLAKLSGENMTHLPIDFVISSPLQRALETARLMIQGREIPIYTDERIQEISFGDFEGECVFESEVVPKDFRQTFYEDPMHLLAPPNGETFAQVLSRTKSLFDELAADPGCRDKHIMISSHGAASRCFLASCLADTSDIWRGCVPPNCGVTTVEYKNGECRILELDHLYYE